MNEISNTVTDQNHVTQLDPPIHIVHQPTEYEKSSPSIYKPSLSTDTPLQRNHSVDQNAAKAASMDFNSGRDLHYKLNAIGSSHGNFLHSINDNELTVYSTTNGVNQARSSSSVVLLSSSHSHSSS